MRIISIPAYFYVLFLFLIFVPIDAFSQSAYRECGNDRRCRIERLRQKNNAKRHYQLQYESASKTKGKEDAEYIRLLKLPRLAKPISIDMRSSLIGIFGIASGYTISEKVRAQFSYQYASISNYAYGLDNISSHQFGLSGEYYLRSDVFGIFLSGGFFMLKGNANSFTFGDFAEIKTVAHFVELGSGLDLQFKQGYRLRIMGAYKYLLYHQATINGLHSERGKDAWRQTFEDDMEIDAILQLGYAF